MPRLIATATLVQLAAILAALVSVLALLAVDRPSARSDAAASTVERVKTLVAIQVESLSQRR